MVSSSSCGGRWRFSWAVVAAVVVVADDDVLGRLQPRAAVGHSAKWPVVVVVGLALVVAAALAALAS